MLLSPLHNEPKKPEDSLLLDLLTWAPVLPPPAH